MVPSWRDQARGNSGSRDDRLTFSCQCHLGEQLQLDYLPKPLKSSPYYHVWCKARADADTPALMAAYDAELLHMKRDGRLKALYDKYGIPYLEP
ncbi:ABC-type amino acid transporter, periplasmic binding protein [Aeromonas media WS]|nr:ABC-type amino acid transporter, periplasmic binding protein [Aeromonas media WS]